MQLPLEHLEKLIKTLEQSGVAEFEYEDESSRVRLVLARGLHNAALTPSFPQVTLPAPAPGGASLSPRAADESDSNIVYVTSPFVGTFYRSPAPESSSFTEVGAQVKKGQTLCIVEAMKLMNEIESEFAGTVLEVVAENGKSVEYGQKLFKLKKA